MGYSSDRCASDSRKEYRGWLEGELLGGALRASVLTLTAVNVATIPLDFLLIPEAFAGFLVVRLMLSAILLLVYSLTSRRHPVASLYVVTFAGSGMLLTVIHGTGGAASGYYVGLVLLFCGIGVLVPISAIRGMSIIAPSLGGYLTMPFLDGEPFAWESFATHLFFLGAAALVGLVSCGLLDRMRFADFCQRREIEAARDELAVLDRAKSRFTANVHHELRTPLTLMLAPVETMLAGSLGELSPTQMRYLRTMHVNGLRLLKLINNLLDLARVESGQLGIRRRQCAVGQLVKDVATGAEPMGERKGVAIETRGLDSLPPVFVDPEAVEKVIVNLIGNALKFTDPGGRIEVSGEAESEGGIHLVVADTGIGLESDQLERIFDRFAQVDMSSTRRHEGTGIGLALARELVEAHGGRIWAESEGLGKGTRVHAVLPKGEMDADGDGDEEVIQGSHGQNVSLARSLGAVQAELSLQRSGQGQLAEIEQTVGRWQQRYGTPEDAPEREDHPRLTLPTDAPEVLIVEDNPDMRELLAFLVGQEFRVRIARTGREGLEAVQQGEPDLILTDVMMPEMSGTELCRRLKENGATAAIPVVLVTSKAEREMKIEGLEGGADDYVTKPFHPRELLARVRSLIRLRELQRELKARNDALEHMNLELEQALAELKEAELQVLQAERLAAVGELAAGVAHEVNNPVNFALNALRALRDHVDAVSEVIRCVAVLDASDPGILAMQVERLGSLRAVSDGLELADEMHELVDIVSEGLDRTYSLVGDLRDFAGSGRGSSSLVDLRQGIQSTVKLLRRSFHEAGVTVETDLSEDQLLVRGDPGAINQLLLNLLKNSAEALAGTRDGRIWVHSRREDTWISTTVRDNGPGVRAEARSRLFEPFFTTKGAGRGTGLGLSICRRIASQHGGTILLTSPPGEGASFTVRLPAEGTKSPDAT